MMRIVLFAFVCVAFAQVRGTQLEDEIEAAIGKFDVIANSTAGVAQNTRDRFDNYSSLLDSRTLEYVQNQTQFRQAANIATKNVSREFKWQAKQANLPKEVFLCISQEATTTVLSISALSTKFQTDMQRLQATKLAILDQQGVEIDQIEDALPGRYEQGVGDLRRSATVSSVRQTLQRLQREYTHTESELKRIGDRMATNNSNFERDAKIMTANTNNAITLAKNLGVRNMRECMPKLA